MTSPLSLHDSAPADIWHTIYSYYTADVLLDAPDKLKIMESILTEKAPVHFEHYMGWLATRVEPLLTESRKSALSAFPDAEKIHHLLLQLRSEGVDLSSVTLSPCNSKMQVDVDDEALVSSAEECYGIEHAIKLGDEIINLAKIATRIPGYTPLATGTDAEKVNHFRIWVSGNRAHCAAQAYLNLANLGLTMFPSELASYFPNLVNLYLEKNQLTSIRLTDLPQLVNLNLSYNELTSISLRGLPQLSILNLSHNKPTSVILRDSPLLYELNLSHNELENELASVILKELPELIHLNLSYNKFTSIRVTDLPHLKGLNLSHNELTSVILGELSLLEKLDLSHNKLTSVCLPELPDLNDLHLSDNQLTSISLSEIPKLFILNLANNRLGSVALKTIERIRGLPFFPSISEIYLSMHDLNLALQEDARAEIMKKYNEIKKADYLDMRATWSDEFLTQLGGARFDKAALLKATLQFLLQRSGGVIT